MTKKVFIDGKAGTTGLRIYERLQIRNDIQLMTLSEEDRKKPECRKEMLNTCDIAFLCLPDDASREAVAMIENPDVVVLDTSTAHRTCDDWAYGFPVTPLKAWQPEKGGARRIQQHMNKLIEWANSDAFKEMDPYLRAVMFHAQFIKIHPFREGNGRTGRMILNYMLLISNLPLTNIRDTDSELYYQGVTEAIVNHNYQPLIDVVKRNKIKYSRELYAAVMQYNKERKRTMEMKLDTKQTNQLCK